MKQIKEYIDEEMKGCPLTIMQEEKLLIALERYIETELQANKNFGNVPVLRSNLPSRIDYEYCHNAKCEIIKYLEYQRIIITEQMEENIKNIIEKVAHNEVDRRQIIS